MLKDMIKRDIADSNGYLAFIQENSAFRRLWTGWTVSSLGDSFNQAAVVFLILTLTGGEGLKTGLAIGLRLSSRLIFAGLGGVIADRLDRRLFLISLDLSLAAAALLFVFAGSTGSLPALYALTVLMGALSAAHASARIVYLQDVAGTARFDRALALMQIGFGMAVFLGNGLGGAMIAVVGCQVVFILDALSFLFSTFCTWTAAPAQAAAAVKAGRSSLRQDWLAGISHLRSQPVLLRMVLTNAIWSLGGGGVFVIVSLLCYQRFDNDPVVLGLFFAMTGAGALAAAAVRPVLGRGFQQDALIIGWACVAEGLLFVLLPHVSSLPLSLVLFAAQLAAAFLFGLAYQPLLLREAAPAMRGRISGLDGGIYLSLYGLAAAVHGALAAAWGLKAAAALAGGIMAAAGLFWLLFLHRRNGSSATTQLCSGK
ncbi:MFS transporter [Candidatus Electronema sp. JC]|uniref:MFS transporter n=1 Tax=Candidatus Electronema sp. JC TaxID=3401570 RepID=UPI003AA82683